MRHLARVPLAVLAALGVACSGSERPQASGDDGGTIVIASPSDAGSLLPPLALDETGRAISDQLYDRLAELGPNLNTIGDAGFAPRLARSWTWAPDSLSITFHLDPRARWHDGAPVRASDVRFTHQLDANPKLGSGVTPLLGNIDSVSVKDSLTAVVWFRKHTPSEFFDYVYQEPILPEHLLGSIRPEQLKTSEVARRGIGTGRFRLARWDAGTRIELVADTGNYRGRAKLDRVIWSVTPDFGAALTQLLTGQADFFESLPPGQVAKVDSSPTVHAVPWANLGYGFVGFNLRDPKDHARPHPIFGDRRVRRALSMAVDRRAMLQNIFGAYGHMSYGPFPTSLGVDTTLRELPFDTVAARALLDSAGWVAPSPGAVRQRAGHPLRFTLLVPSSSRIRVNYAVLLQNQLRRVGAQVDIDQQEFNTFLARQDARDFDAVINVWAQDPGFGGTIQNWSSAGMGKGGQNVVSYSNPTFDALIDSAAASFDPGKAHAYAKRAFQVAVDDAPGIWIYDMVSIAGAHRRLHIVGLRADEGWWSRLADWSIPANERIARDRIGLAAGHP